MVRCARDGCHRRLPGVLAKGLDLGVMVDGRWYCSARCVEHLVRAAIASLRSKPIGADRLWGSVRLGALLVRQVGLPDEVVETALAQQGRLQEPLGRTLRRLGVITANDLLRALAMQAGVRYLASVDPAAVAHRHGQLSDETVRALRIVPVAADPKRRALQVACTAPIPGQAVRALARITDSAVEPMLVADEALPPLVELYARAVGRNGNVRGTRCVTDSGPRIVARTARAHREVRMLCERCDPYVWVRLDSEDGMADVLMATPASEEE
ncbi:MAG: hypothetical protein AB1806_01610 [Acidobacteriota bacterium]